MTAKAPGRELAEPKKPYPNPRLVGLLALVFSAPYLLSDVIETIEGGFSSAQLWLRPSWTGAALVLVAISQTRPEGPQVIAAAVRDPVFAGMGAGLLGAGVDRATRAVPRLA